MQSIIIADSHHLFREALCAYLRYADPDLKVEGAGDFQSLQTMLREKQADLILLDASLSGWSGSAVDVTESGAAKFGLLVPLLQSEIVPEPYISGVFPKSLSCKAFMTGINSVMEGQGFFPSLQANAVALEQDRSGRRGIQDFRLTTREKEVLCHLVKGASNKDIARALDLQVVTVKLHVRGICRKMKASNRTQAALMARENGWG